MNKEFVTDILECLYLVRDDLLDESSICAAYNLGLITASLESILEYQQAEKDFGHT